MRYSFLIYFSSISLFVAVSSYGQDGQTLTDLYHSSTYQSGVTQDLSLSSIWKTGSFDGAEFTGSVTETADNINFLHLKQTMPSGDKRTTAFTFSDSLKVAGIDADITLNDNNWEYNMLKVGDGKSLAVSGDFTLNLSSKTSNPWVYIVTGKASSIEIQGDFIVSRPSSEGGWVRFGFSQSGSGDAFSVANNMSISGNIVELTIGIKTFTVGGMLSIMNGSHFNLARIYTISGPVVRKLGGLNGGGKMEIYEKENQVSLEFTNSVAGDFTGYFAKEYSSINNSTLDIVMNASDAANGKQTLRFDNVETYTFDGYTYSGADISSVTVKNGELSLATHSGMTGGYLEIAGKDAVFSATGVASGEVGTVNFDSAWWSLGTIRVDFSEAEGADKITVANEFYVSNPAAVSLSLNVSAEDLDIWLDTSGLEYMDFTILEFGSTNVNAGEVMDMVGLESGVFAELLADDFANGKLTLRLTTVPEPAWTAAIFALFAVAAAVVRLRRK